MDLSRWISLGFVALYIVLLAYLPAHPAGTQMSVDDEMFDGKQAGGVFLVIGFVCVWAKDTPGDALWVGRGAWNPKPSTPGAVAVLGWLFLTLASAIPILDSLY